MNTVWEITTVMGRTTAYDEPSWVLQASDEGVELTFKGEQRISIPWFGIETLRIREQGRPAREMTGVL